MYREEYIELEVGDEKISGFLTLPEGEGTHPLAIISHGDQGNKLGPNRFFVKFAREAAREGFATFRYDFRGSGDSDGNFEEQITSTMKKDLKSVIEELVEHEEIDEEKIALIGHSQGGQVSLLEAADSGVVSGLILWMARTSNLEDFIFNAWQDELYRKGYYSFHGRKYTLEQFKDDNRKDSITAMEKLNISVKMIYGGKDEFVPISEGVKLKENTETEAELEIVDNLNHYFTGREVQEQVIDQTLKWLEEIKN